MKEKIHQWADGFLKSKVEPMTYDNYSYEICGTAIDRDLDLATLLGRNETLVLDTIR